MKQFLKDLLNTLSFIIFSLLLFFGGFNLHKKFYAEKKILKKQFEKELIDLKEEYLLLEEKDQRTFVQYNDQNVIKELQSLKKELVEIKENQRCQDSLTNTIHEEIGILHEDLIFIEDQLKLTQDLVVELKKKRKSYYVEKYIKPTCDTHFLANLWTKYCSKKSKETYSKKKFQMPFLSNMCVLTKDEYVKKECSIY